MAPNPFGLVLSGFGKAAGYTKVGWKIKKTIAFLAEPAGYSGYSRTQQSKVEMAEPTTGLLPGVLLGPEGLGVGVGGSAPGPCSVPCHLRGLGVRALVGGLDEHGLGDVLARGHRHLLDLVQLLQTHKVAQEPL